jgi:Tat protein translocase TatB subunit
MNIFSNIGITELIIILLLALIVVGPERLPEMGRKLGEVLRDIRKAYENLTKDLGPELASLQKTTQELRQSVDSVTSIPQDMVDTMVKATDLEDTIGELKDIQDSVGQIGQSVSAAGKMVKDPVGAAVDTAKGALMPAPPAEEKEAEAAEAVDASAEPEQATPEPVAEVAVSDSEAETESQETAVQDEVLDSVDTDQEEKPVSQEQSHE